MICSTIFDITWYIVVKTNSCTRFINYSTKINTFFAILKTFNNVFADIIKRRHLKLCSKNICNCNNIAKKQSIDAMVRCCFKYFFGPLKVVKYIIVLVGFL